MVERTSESAEEGSWQLQSWRPKESVDCVTFGGILVMLINLSSNRDQRFFRSCDCLVIYLSLSIGCSIDLDSFWQVYPSLQQQENITIYHDIQTSILYDIVEF